MKKLSKEDVEHIASLARLGLTEKEKEKFRDQLSSILDYVKKLQKVDTGKIKPIAQITGLENITREDEVKEFKEVKKLIDAAPMKKNNLVKVKAVLQK